jgi:hypothetical protein
MNTRHPTTLSALSAVAALAAAFAAPAFAQEATPDGFAALQSTASRAEVRAEAATALRAGEIERGEASVERSAFVASKTRAQVAAEAREALRLGVIGHGEGPAPVPSAQQAESIRLAGQNAMTHTLAQR